MIIPPLCQSCGQPVGHLWTKYIKLVQKYAEEDGVKLRDGGMLVDEGKALEKKPSPEFRALQTLAKENNFNQERYCCRFAFLCNHDISSFIH